MEKPGCPVLAYSTINRFVCLPFQFRSQYIKCDAFRPKPFRAIRMAEIILFVYPKTGRQSLCQPGAAYCQGENREDQKG